MLNELLLSFLPLISAGTGVMLKHGFMKNTKIFFFTIIISLYTLYLFIYLKIHNIEIYFTIFSVISAIFFAIGRMGLTKILVNSLNAGAVNALYRSQIALSALLTGLMFNTTLNYKVIIGIVITILGVILLSKNQLTYHLNRNIKNAFIYGGALTMSDIFARKCLIEKMSSRLIAFTHFFVQSIFLWIKYFTNYVKPIGFHKSKDLTLYGVMILAVIAHIIWDEIFVHFSDTKYLNYGKAATLLSILIVAFISKIVYKEELTINTFMGILIIVIGIMIINLEPGVGTQKFIF